VRRSLKAQVYGHPASTYATQRNHIEAPRRILPSRLPSNEQGNQRARKALIKQAP